MDYIPESNFRVLELLATYKFLTVKQFITLGLAKHKESVHRILTRFGSRHKKLTGKKDLGAIPGQGRFPVVYYLTQRGAETLAEYYRLDVSEIPYPKSVNFFKQDFFHRIATVDFHIALRKWTEENHAVVEFVDTYFETTGNNRMGGKSNRLTSKARVALSNGFIIPDMIYSVTLANGKSCLTAVEIHNGKDTGRFMRQMEKHIQALVEGAITEKYGMQVACFVLGLFEHESIRNASLERLKQGKDWKQFERFIALDTLQKVQQYNHGQTGSFRFVGSM